MMSSSEAGKVAALGQAVDGEPDIGRSTGEPDIGTSTTEAELTEVDSATAPAASRRLRRHRGGYHRLPSRRPAIFNRRISYDRRARLRVLAGSLTGAGCLVLAYRLQTFQVSPFAAPSGMVAWIALMAGIVGIWLVPGLWLSAVMMRTGVGPVARLATRIGSTLAWYALVGPVIHLSGQGALVTPGGIVGATVAATAATCLGLFVGLISRPANPALRFLLAALAGGICAQTVIWVSMRLFTDGVNYEHIRRLDWLIVLACALLTAIGAHTRPDLHMVRTPPRIRSVLVFLAVVAVTAVALVATGNRWSPAQRMPSAIGAEQVAAPPGADVALALTAIGPEGPGLIRRAAFTASDDAGRPVPVRTRLVEEATAGQATLLVLADPLGRTTLCERAAEPTEQGLPVKLTMRDQSSGVLVQAVMPNGWCAR